MSDYKYKLFFCLKKYITNVNTTKKKYVYKLLFWLIIGRIKVVFKSIRKTRGNI
jgi:hypothetical protein